MTPELDPMGRITYVCVPKPGVVDPTLAMLAPGSGIVALPMSQNDRYVRVYYEGNLLGACNQHEIDERIVNAWGRLVYRYPTIAMTALPREKFEAIFEVVGTTDGKVLYLMDGGRAKLDAVQAGYSTRGGRHAA
jgi:hypothetical protein